MKIVFVGTNGWYDSSIGNTTCVLVETSSYIIILGAGSGIVKLDTYVNFSKPTFLLLSHFHWDHIIGLHVISKFNFHGGLFICGSGDVKVVLERVISFPFTIPFEKMNYEINYIKLAGDVPLLPFPLKVLPLVHSGVVLGFRFLIDNKIVAYCTDTGYCENAVKFAKEADLLITECAFKSGQEDVAWPHLNPEKTAMIAKEAASRKLGLMHFDAAICKTKKERAQAEGIARCVLNNTVATEDDVVIEL